MSSEHAPSDKQKLYPQSQEHLEGHKIFDPRFLHKKNSTWAPYEQAKKVSQIIFVFTKIFDAKFKIALTMQTQNFSL